VVAPFHDFFSLYRSLSLCVLLASHAAGVRNGWWIESVAQYQGHEERLPIDGHGVMAMIAPRAAAIADGAKPCLFEPFINQSDLFTKTGSGQT
jgi:hypothetical protein